MNFTTIKFSKQVADFIKDYASFIVTETGIYFYMPYWFKQGEDEQSFEKLSWDSLPKDLLDSIREEREKNNTYPGGNIKAIDECFTKENKT